MEAYAIYINFVFGLTECIQKDFKLFLNMLTSEPSVKVILIEDKVRQDKTKGSTNKGDTRDLYEYMKDE